jgi:uncharacterized protein (DUF58 family)
MPYPPLARSEAGPEFGASRTPKAIGASRLDARPALITAAGGLALIVAALAFGAVPLLVPGVGFLVLAMLAPGWLLLAGRAAGVQRRLAADRIIEDQPLETVVEVRRGVLGLPGGELRDPLARAPVSLAEPMSVLPGRRRVALRVVTRVHRRGRHSFPPPELTLSDGFGLARLRRGGEGDAAEILVLPRTEAVRWRSGDHRRAPSGLVSPIAHEPRGAGELDGLRQYMPGTPASRIHWPALARYPNPPILLERRLIAESERHPLVVLDARLDSQPGAADRLDAAVRAAASLTLALARSGGCGLLLPGDQVPLHLNPGLTGWPSAHARLALVEGEIDPRRGPRLRAGAPASALIWVAPAAGWPLPRRAIRGGPLVLVVPDAPGAGAPPDTPVAFEVSGCTGHLIASPAVGPRRRASSAA